MSHEYGATVCWERTESADEFAKGRYSRAHRWSFDGGISIAASASPWVVPLPHSRADAVDPEEAYIAALSSCHMLTFVDLARRAKLIVDRYEDTAVGVMQRLATARFWISRVTLRPKIAFSDPAPDAEALSDLHERAHEICFIANSVKTEIVVELT